MQVLKGPKGLRLCCQRGESLRTQCTPRLGPTQVTYAFEHPHHRHVEMQMRYADMLRPRLTGASSPGGVELQFRAAACPTRGQQGAVVGQRRAARAACPTVPSPVTPRPRFPRRGPPLDGWSAAPLLRVRPGVRLTPAVWPGGLLAVRVWQPFRRTFQHAGIGRPLEYFTREYDHTNSAHHLALGFASPADAERFKELVLPQLLARAK